MDALWASCFWQAARLTGVHVLAWQAVYGTKHDTAPLRAAQHTDAGPSAEAPLTAPQFVMLLLHPRSGFPAFGALHAAVGEDAGRS